MSQEIATSNADEVPAIDKSLNWVYWVTGKGLFIKFIVRF